MMSLNFQAEKHAKLLEARKKTCTVRLGDVSSQFPENSICWITVGHQNPDINSRAELIADFERIYNRRINMDDVVTVIDFTEVVE